jgi:hypothetical protein
MMAPCWQTRRSTFNHDWLKNRFIPALARFMNLLDDLVEDSEFERSFTTRILLEWEEHRSEALSLCLDFEREMSPRVLLDSPPLSYCDDETRQWLGNVIHALWLARYPVRDWIAEASASVSEADAAYDLLHSELIKFMYTQSVCTLYPLRQLFADFLRKCRKLANSIERFPSEVMVT